MILRIILATILFLTSPLYISSVYAQNSNCVVTAVGDNAGPSPTLPANCLGGGNGNVVYFCQMDPKWNGSNYPEFGAGNTCMAGAGCGPTSLAMIISSYGIPMTPVEVDRLFQANGWRAGCGAGSGYGRVIEPNTWFSNLGFTVGSNVVVGGKPDLILMKQYIDQGYLIYNGADNYPCLGCVTAGMPVGHVFVIDDVDIAGKRVHTRDPNNCTASTGVELTHQSWVKVAADSADGPETSPFNASAATWNGSFPIKKM